MHHDEQAHASMAEWSRFCILLICSSVDLGSNPCVVSKFVWECNVIDTRHNVSFKRVLSVQAVAIEAWGWIVAVWTPPQQMNRNDLKKTLMHWPLSPVEGIAWIQVSLVGQCVTAGLRLLDFWTDLWCGMVWYGMDGCLLKWFQDPCLGKLAEPLQFWIEQRIEKKIFELRRWNCLNRDQHEKVG